MDCEWKSIRFYGFSMDSNDQTGSRYTKDPGHEFGSLLHSLASEKHTKAESKRGE